MSHFLPNSFNGDKIIHNLNVEISDIGEEFLKEFSRDFYKKIIDIYDIDILENTLIEWIKNINKNTELIFELMKNHEQNKFWFSRIIGFFYQFGISCDIDKNKALDLYLSAVNIHDDEFLNKNFIYLHLLKENDKEFDILQNNIIIGKYLLSLFYYKDIILNERFLSNSSDFVFEYLKSARKDDPVAQYNLGHCYFYGKGISQDYNKAFEWYLKSADNGCAEGQNGLGNCYYYGNGKTQDCYEAVRWYLKSAKNGYAEGQYNLGYCYYNGIGIAKNYIKAFEWYLKSANNGCAEGQNGLGNCYYYGYGVNKDCYKAFEWYSKSANNECVEGQNNLGECYFDGAGTAQNYTKAFEWFLKSANNECVKGQYNLGECYYWGIGTTRSYNEAFKWYFKSANCGNRWGQYYLGHCYHYGEGTDIDFEEAIIWYEKASINGIEAANIELNKILPDI